MTSQQRDRGPPAGAVHGHGKADGLPDGFRSAKRASGPPFGSTGNAPVGRPPGQQPFHTLGFVWKTLRVSHTAPRLIFFISSVYEKLKTGTAALRWPLLLHHLTGHRPWDYDTFRVEPTRH
jgi:hypothetical protein